MKKWYSIELEPNIADLLKYFLKKNGIKFETSQCYNLIHFEIFIDSNEVLKIESILN